MEYIHLYKKSQTNFFWKHSFSNELDRLAQGARKRVKRMETLLFTNYGNITSEHIKDITYVRIVVKLLPQKDKSNHNQLTVGGNLIEYHRDTRTSTDDTTTANILWNSVVSTPKAKYMCIDINNVYLSTPLTRYEYLCIETT